MALSIFLKRTAHDTRVTDSEGNSLLTELSIQKIVIECEVEELNKVTITGHLGEAQVKELLGDQITYVAIPKPGADHED